MEALIPILVNAAASYAISTLLAQEQKYSQEGARLTNLDVIGSQYGVGIPLVYGQMRLATNIIWSKPLREVVTTTTQSAGGKGGGGTSVTTTGYTYFASFASLICQGVMARPKRIWADKNLIWEAPVGVTVLADDLVDGGTFEFFTGSAAQTRSAIIEAVLGTSAPAYRGRCYIVIADLPVDKYGRRIPAIEVEVESVTTPQVADIITDLCTLAGIDPLQIDITTVSNEVWGAKIAPGPVGQSIESLTLGLGIQSVYDGTALAFRPIEQTLCAEITQDDLLAGDSRFPIKRLREDDLPRTVRIAHIDPARDYQAGSQQVIRQITRSVQEISLATPVAIGATQAHALCDALMYRAWTARVQYGPFGLPPKYLYLEPGDVVGITVDGRRHIVRLRQITVGANGALDVQGEAYDASVLTGTSGSGSSGEFTSGQLPSFGVTTMRLLNAPALTDAQAQQTGYRIAATGTGASWRSASLEQSIDAGASWSVVAVLPTYSTMGSCNTTLSAPSAYVGDANLDLTNTLEVTIIRGTLSSVSDAQLATGGNMAMVGSELIQFGTAALVSAGVYLLSRLLRGRKGTNHAMAAHVAAEGFTLLDGTVFVPLSVSELGTEKTYRVTPIGGATGAADVFTPTGVSAKPWSPARIKGTRNDPYFDLTLTWSRRSRVGTELPNNGDIPLDEATEEYSVDIYNGASVVRTVSTSANTYTYTESQQIADFGSVQSTVSVAIYQISNLVGRGSPATAVI